MPNHEVGHLLFIPKAQACVEVMLWMSLKSSALILKSAVPNVIQLIGEYSLSCQLCHVQFVNVVPGAPRQQFVPVWPLILVVMGLPRISSPEFFPLQTLDEEPQIKMLVRFKAAHATGLRSLAVIGRV